MRFKNREQAGKMLADRLINKYNNASKDFIVLALPRGGVPVAYQISERLKAPLDVFLVRKLGVEGQVITFIALFRQEELAMGAITETATVFNHDIIDVLRIDEKSIKRVIAKEKSELQRRNQKYRKGKTPVDVSGKIIILVDDGIATGATMSACCTSLKQLNPKKLVVAVPVAASDTISKIIKKVDDVVCVLTPENLMGIGQWYEDFTQMEDQEVLELLEKAEKVCSSKSKPKSFKRELELSRRVKQLSEEKLEKIVKDEKVKCIDDCDIRKYILVGNQYETARKKMRLLEYDAELEGSDEDENKVLSDLEISENNISDDLNVENTSKNNVENTKDIQNIKANTHIKDIGNVKDTENTKDIEINASIKDIGNVEDTKNTKNVEINTSTEDIVNVEDTNNTKDIGDIEVHISSEDVGNVEDIQNTKDVEDIEVNTSIEDVGNVEDTRDIIGNTQDMEYIDVNTDAEDLADTEDFIGNTQDMKNIEDYLDESNSSLSPSTNHIEEINDDN
ncbi:7499_t:CDS:10 [Entrophospora sp. SA101]|nr:7496_t:CDS:10 [Entrophospora sp. SA101]CAJ0913299.1 7499_t:CDS:10 [Entrophospora sp. SA101]